jgi:o-succinylbenzoate---CoA ligase
VIIQFENVQLKLDEILHENFILHEFNGIEFNVLRLITYWFSDQDTFVFETSGSTGSSKQITIERKKIQYSTKATFDAIDPDGKISSSLLCIDPQFIGGAMVVFRALIMNHDLRVVEPSGNPLESLKRDEKYDLASMVPLQYHNSNIEDLNKIGNILIGGAPIRINVNAKLKSVVYSTFGMTETVSHIALKTIDTPVFHTTGDIIIDTNVNGTLRLNGTITDHKWLLTNDVVEKISTTEFIWIGRKDFIINSGGIKQNPETIESVLRKEIKIPFLVSSLPDKLLGEKLILILEGHQIQKIDYSDLTKFEVPKQIHILPKIPRTTSGKLDRNAARKILIEELGLAL